MTSVMSLDEFPKNDDRDKSEPPAAEGGAVDPDREQQLKVAPAIVSLCRQRTQQYLSEHNLQPTDLGFQDCVALEYCVVKAVAEDAVLRAVQLQNLIDLEALHTTIDSILDEIGMVVAKGIRIYQEEISVPPPPDVIAKLSEQLVRRPLENKSPLITGTDLIKKALVAIVAGTHLANGGLA